MYVIKNGSSYIRLDKNGTPVTCGKSERGQFTKTKADNIYHSLPRTLKKFHFTVELEPEMVGKVQDNDMHVISNYEYKPPESITNWIDKFGNCQMIFSEAVERKKQLKTELNEIERQCQDLMHVIELEKSKNMYDGWKIYKDLKDLRGKRRNIKDEITVISSVMDNIDVACLSRTEVESVVKGLSQRVYRFRAHGWKDEGDGCEDLQKL